MTAADLLVAVRDPDRDPLPTLLDALEAPDAAVRLQAVRHLAEMPTPRAVPALVRRLEADPDADVRWEAAETLGVIGAPSAADALRAALSGDLSDAVRLCAAEALGVCGRDDRRATAALCRALNDPDPAVRVFAAESLGDRGDPTAVPVLRRWRDCPCQSPAVRVWLFYALARLGAEPFALDETLAVLAADDFRGRTQAAKVLARTATHGTAPRIADALRDALAREEAQAAREVLADRLRVVDGMMDAAIHAGSLSGT